MPEMFINGEKVTAQPGQTVMQAALAHGFFIPYFCWHPSLSIAGNCRMCVVEVEDPKGGNWIEIACNMPVTEGMRVLTDSDGVKARRKETLQFILLNHPVDCGICDKAGECTLQEYHVAYNGEPSVATVPKHQLTKFHPLSSRITLDNERCILCSRCVRFTHEVSGSKSLGIQRRGDDSVIRAVESGAFERDPYSDNVVDLCPVGALQSRQFLYKARVWYLKPTASVCPGCERGCNIDLWHRKSEWAVKALDARTNARIDRVTPRENPAVQERGPFICNKGRDLAAIFERPRAEQAMLKGKPVDLHKAVESARALLRAALRPVVLVSSWGSNEELAALRQALPAGVAAFVKADHVPVPDERIEDDVLIKADKNPNGRRARELFGSAPIAYPADTDLVLVWGEGVDFATLPRGVKTILMGSVLAPENGHADVFIPLSIQTERAGSYTNFAGVVSRFERCFAKQPTVIDAEALFAALGQHVSAEVPA